MSDHPRPHGAGSLWTPSEQCAPGYCYQNVPVGWEFNDDVKGGLISETLELGWGAVVEYFGLGALAYLPVILSLGGSTHRPDLSGPLPGGGVDDMAFDGLDEATDTNIGGYADTLIGVGSALSDGLTYELYCGVCFLFKPPRGTFIETGYFPGRPPESLPLTLTEVTVSYNTYVGFVNTGQLINHSIMDLQVFNSMEEYFNNQ